MPETPIEWVYNEETGALRPRLVRVDGIGDIALDPSGDPPWVVWLKAGDFESGQGAPVKSVVSSRWPAWTLRDAVTDRINSTFLRPPDATTVDIDVLWANTSATTGNVVFRVHLGLHTVGDGASTLSTQPAVTVPGQAYAYELRRHRVASGIDISSASMPLVLLERVGSDDADTLTNSVVVVGLAITPSSADPVLASDGAWCWFNEPRLIVASGKVYGGMVRADGTIAVSSLDPDTGTTVGFDLHTRLEVDDHDAPGIVELASGKLAAFYSRHSVVDDPIYWRVTTSAGDISAWDAEQTITLPAGAQPCYPKPVLIGTRLYVFFRNALYHDFIYSDDDGATWSDPATLFQWSSGWRGYVNLVVNGSRVDFICNDDNPNATSSCNLYHCYLEEGTVKATDGTTIAALGTAITTAELTKVYDHATDGDAWGWDIQLDADNRPVVVFATFPTTSDHHYYYARWGGTAWDVNLITNAGKAFPERGGEPRYSGGLALLSSDPSVVYLSRQVDITWEVERWVTADGGTSFSSEPVTSNSTTKMLRPTTPEGHTAGVPEVFWMSGWYSTFKLYGTRLVYRD